MSKNSQIKQYKRNMEVAIRKLRRKKKELPLSAFEVKGNECTRCSFCCWVKPCKLSKDDVIAMSEKFGISPEDLFRTYLIIDIDNQEGNMCITPIRKNNRKYAGTLITSKNSFNVDAPCVFLKEKQCTIQDLKPEGAKRYKCWNAPETIEESMKLCKDLYWSKFDIENMFKVKLEVI